jgi:dTDP-glucose 4,6-dehydratase
MSYFVLGSNSFAGSCFVNHVISQHEKVIGVSRSTELHPVMQPYGNHSRKNAYEFFQLDLNNDLAAIRQLIEKNKPRYIVDFAGQGMVAESWSDPAQWYQTNIVAKAKLHHFLKDCDFLERYIRVSTPEVYGNSNEKMYENQPYAPSTPYAVSHAAIDLSLSIFHKQFQFPMILTRFANFYGPHQQLYRIIPRTMIYALLNNKLPLHGGGTSERMFIFGDDVADGIFKTIHTGKIGETYHFANGPCISIRNLVEKMCDLMRIDFSSFVEVAAERAGKDYKYEMDASKSHHELHWKPAHSLEQGLEKTFQWIKNNLATIKALPLNYIHKP